MYVVQDRVEYDKQLLVEIDYPPLVYRFQIDRTPGVHDRAGRCNRPSPVDLVEARVEILDREKKEVPVVLLELEQGKENVKECGGLSEFTLAHRRDLPLIDYPRLGIRLAEYAERTVYPYRESVDEFALDRGQGRGCVHVHNVFWRIFAEHPVLFVPAFCKQNLRKDEHAIVHLLARIEVVPDVVDRHHAVNRLEHALPEDVFDNLDRVLVLFNDDLHNLYAVSRNSCQSLSIDLSINRQKLTFSAAHGTFRDLEAEDVVNQWLIDG